MTDLPKVVAITPLPKQENSQAPAFPRVRMALFWIIVYFVVQSCFTLAVASEGKIALILQISTDMQSPLSLRRLGIGTIWGITLAGIVTVALLVLNMRDNGRKEAIGLFANSRLPLRQTVAISIALLAIAYGLNYLYASYVIPDVIPQEFTKKILAAVPKTPFNWTLIFLAAAVFAPLVEELLFRGYLQTALKRHMGSWGAIAVAAIIFGIVHMDPYAMPGLVLLGGAFGYIYEKTGSLKTNILLHLVNNSLALALG